ncbi:MAG: alpha-galactosidase [Bacteroidota bacterium]
MIKNILWACLLSTLTYSLSGQDTRDLLQGILAYQFRAFETSAIPAAEADWLVHNLSNKPTLSRLDERTLVLHNGLVSRTFWLGENLACTSIKNLRSEEEYLRAVKPEAWLMIDSVSYPVGGLIGQPERGYLRPDWLSAMKREDSAFHLVSIESQALKPHIPWKKRRWTPKTQWKQQGLEVIFTYQHHQSALAGIKVAVHYQLFAGLPLIAKWIEVDNQSPKRIHLNHFASEVLAFHEQNNYVDNPDQWDKPRFHLENDYAFGGFTYAESDQAISWESDPEYTSQVNWDRLTPVLLKSQPHRGPEMALLPGATFTSFRTYFLALDGTDRERNSLSLRKMYRTLAPWATENPIFLHLTSTDPEQVKTAIDQCAEVGYEMVILSFGSGLNMEDVREENVKKFKELTDYARSKGIELGGYSLFSSRTIHPETDVIDIKTGQPGGAKFGGHAPCLASQWGLDYLAKLRQFLAQTGFSLLEHDGPYPGDFCASKSHPGHAGYGDSQWQQWQLTRDFYQYLRSEGIYTNIPDFYLLAGSNKVGIGYREVNWSLPRAQQLMLGRQNIYDGTWTRTPSMGWTFVPLTEYHGGGAAATLEPLEDHLADYAAHMTQNYGSGVQACYRGPRLYDSPKTMAVVKAQIDHYKAYRDILNADIIHLRRPDGRDWDGIMHVDPQLEWKAYALLFNPTDQPIQKNISLPLYYAGLNDFVSVSLEGAPPVVGKLNRAYELVWEVKIPAGGHTWLLIK